MTPEVLITITSGKTCSLTDPVGGSRPEWTLAEAGYSAAGLEQVAMLAFWHRYARDPAVYWELVEALADEAALLSRTNRWPKRIAGQPYLGTLVRLAIAEDHMSDVQRHKLHEFLPGKWPENTWDRELAPRYKAICYVLDNWCLTAHEFMARRIRGDE